jgi:uncharacterized membrane protein
MGMQPHPTLRDLVPRFILGIATGLLIGLLASLSPVLVVVAVVAVLISAAIGVVQHIDTRRSMLLAGALVGAGAIFLYGVINTIAACIVTDDFCGNANVWPLAVIALVTIGGGVAAAVVVAVRVRG